MSISRRAFLRTTAGGLATAFVAGSGTPQDKKPETAPPPRPAAEAAPAGLAPQDTLFLTWQRDPTTTVTVQWIGLEKADATVRVVPRTGDEWKSAKVELKAWPKTELKVHRAEFTGLTPGTEYLLQVGKGPQTHQFRTMPAKATNTFQWVSGGDCGTNAHAIANNVLAAKQEPHFALISGDLGYDNGTSAKTALRFYQNYAKHMIDPKGRLIPLVTTLGNHEVRGGYNGKREDATYYLPLFDGLYKDTTYGTLDFGDYLSLVLLDTGHVAKIGGEQTDWLEEALQAR
ncbi:MAG TPA: metallophosphoesterase family protein, partial [Gemmata sp.]